MKVIRQQPLFVAEVFRSFQGEGAKIGTPSLFLRLGICNLQCIWCDTPYTWKEGQRDYRSFTVKDVVKQLKKVQQDWKVPNVVITGGEPLLQQASVVALLEDTFFAQKTIEFETNGSMPLTAEMKDLMKRRTISFNVSPKLADSGNRDYKVHIYPGAVLKFVYVGKKSETLIDEFVNKYGAALKNVKIYIMPEGVTTEAMEKKTGAAMAYCGKKGYLFTPRLQIYLFGNKRAT